MPKKPVQKLAGPSNPSGSPNPSPPADRVRIVVKFRDNDISDNTCGEGGLEKYLNEVKNGAWDKIIGLIPQGTKLRPLFTSITPQKLQEQVKRASDRYPSCKTSVKFFLTYFVLDCPPGMPAAALVKKLRARKSVVEKAYIDQRAMDPAPSRFIADPRPIAVKQDYLDEINARFAWGKNGGDGSGQKAIDLEAGWTLNHQDLRLHNIPAPITGVIDDASRPHGTSVLGVICATGGPDQYAGIAPKATARVVSHSNTASEIANAINTAISTLSFGDVLVLETMVGNRPCETYSDPRGVMLVLEMIRHATAQDIVVVEAAGNNRPADDLDGIIVGDSGAIIVGAATPANSPVPHCRLNISNFGRRVDCYACGENVYAPSSDAASATDLYDNFNSTSAATAIIAGVVLSIQGMAEANPNPNRRFPPHAGHPSRFSPAELKKILRRRTNGTQIRDSAGNIVGVMPDLQKIFANEI